ncbi:hypothetical protein G4B88_027681 [Cannabis sativa]|uniref:Uncharacterized protein n=1 Tax=Cannabis sativa TaxID=3483 RepID=A0A7J6ERW9_CANSA|nr:hypothetical protein G4B88_027681 [Cannabis sativa]
MRIQRDATSSTSLEIKDRYHMCSVGAKESEEEKEAKYEGNVRSSRKRERYRTADSVKTTGGNTLSSQRVARLPFLPLDPRTPDIAPDVFQNLSPHVQACVPDLLRVVLTCLDNVTDSDGSLRALRAKIASFIATNSSRNWPRDLYEKIARSL